MGSVSDLGVESKAVIYLELPCTQLVSGEVKKSWYGLGRYLLLLGLELSEDEFANFFYDTVACNAFRQAFPAAHERMVWLSSWPQEYHKPMAIAGLRKLQEWIDLDPQKYFLRSFPISRFMEGVFEYLQQQFVQLMGLDTAEMLIVIKGLPYFWTRKAISQEDFLEYIQCSEPVELLTRDHRRQGRAVKVFRVCKNWHPKN